MLPFILSAHLFLNTIQPLTWAGNALPSEAKKNLAILGTSIRARVLAPLVAKGMTARQVFDILGDPSWDGGTGITELWDYSPGGVSVRFQTSDSKHVVTDVWITMFPEFIRRLYSTCWMISSSE